MSQHLVDPQLLPLLGVLPIVPTDAETLQAARSQVYPVAEYDGTPTKLDRFAIPGPPNAPDVIVHVYRPAATRRALPCVVHMHGGGFVMGRVETSAADHRRIAAEQDCALVSVEYRLAPETVFPGAIEDCYAALAWVYAEAGSLGIDAARIGVMGESAGGGLAAALALLARDRGEYALAFQHLMYPMLDDRTCTGQPHPFAGEFVWAPDNNRFGWASLLGHAPGADGVSPYAAPARAADLSGLPPTFLATGALDLFVDEDIDYARRLIRAGVPTELHVYPGAFHAFDLMRSADITRQAYADRRQALRRVLE